MRTSFAILLIMLSSCSSFKRTLISSALTGGMLGAIGGNTFSPNEESRDRNAYLFGAVGALTGMGLAYLFRDREETDEGKNRMLLDQDNQTHKEVPLFDFSPELKNIRPEVTFKPLTKYEVPLEKLPKSLEGKVKKQYIIEYEAQARTLNIGTRTIEISPFKAWEHVYEE